MASLVKRYADAFCEALGDAAQSLLQYKEKVQECYKDHNFFEIMKNPFIAASLKLSLLEEILEIKDKQIHQALAILARHERLILLPRILQEMHKLLNLSENLCVVNLFAQKSLDPNSLKNFQRVLEKKIGYQVHLQEKKWDKEGVRCSIEDLDLEISFSRESLLKDFKEFILDSFIKGV